MVSPAGSRRFAARAASADKRLIEYPGAYHALFADVGREQVLADVAGWIEARL
jgi:alpha-beta hydrolase superfamily lysophospholipase